MGRKMHPSNQAFGKWCVELGFDDISSGDRSDAMWFADYPVGNAVPAGLTHPKHIRQWDREQVKVAILPADLAEITPEKVETVALDQRSAERIAKASHRAALFS